MPKDAWRSETIKRKVAGRSAEQDRRQEAKQEKAADWWIRQATAAKKPKQQNTKKAANKKRPTPQQQAHLPPIPPQVTYKEYLRGKWWKRKRREKLQSVKHRCERCGSRASQVHHRHYQTLGRERHMDLEAICRPCHEYEHEGIIAADRHLQSIVASE